MPLRDGASRRLALPRRRRSAPAERALGAGIILAGVYLVADNAPAIARFAIELLWYSEASRQDYVPGIWSSVWRERLTQAGVLVLGAALALRGRRVGAFLWNRDLPAGKQD